MKIVAVICNIVLIGFTCFVILTDGAPEEAIYIVFSLLLVFIPILNAVVIYRSGAHSGWLGSRAEGKVFEKRREIDETSSNRGIVRIVTIICNIVLLGFACWAIMDQYPHPREAGLIEFELLVMLTPVLSAIVIFLSGRNVRWLSLQIKRKA